MCDRVDSSIADHEVGLALQDRGDEFGDVLARVLSVGVGVDNDVGAEAQAGVQPGGKASGQPAIAGKADDVVDAALSSDGDCIVGAAVVDDQCFDAVYPVDVAGQVGQRGG